MIKIMQVLTFLLITLALVACSTHKAKKTLIETSINKEREVTKDEPHLQSSQPDKQTSSNTNLSDSKLETQKFSTETPKQAPSSENQSSKYETEAIKSQESSPESAQRSKASKNASEHKAEKRKMPYQGSNLSNNEFLKGIETTDIHDTNRHLSGNTDHDHDHDHESEGQHTKVIKKRAKRHWNMQRIIKPNNEE